MCYICKSFLYLAFWLALGLDKGRSRWFCIKCNFSYITPCICEEDEEEEMKKKSQLEIEILAALIRLWCQIWQNLLALVVDHWIITTCFIQECLGQITCGGVIKPFICLGLSGCLFMQMTHIWLPQVGSESKKEQQQDRVTAKHHIRAKYLNCASCVAHMSYYNIPVAHLSLATYVTKMWIWLILRATRW